MLCNTLKLKSISRFYKNSFMGHLACLTLLFVPFVSSNNHLPPLPAFTNYGHHSSSSSGRSNAGNGNYLSGSDTETYFNGVGEDEGLLGGSGALSMCLSNYEISEGSIIRTKDSQELGAKFLNESDLGSGGHDECLKLCCRTPRCNVAVFQEKNSGSCYMFDCGSTEDFRCKFTSEINYMSAILRRREVQVGPQQQPSHTNSQQQHSTSNNQHEAELNQLRRTQAGEILEMKESLRSGGGGSGPATSLSKSSTSTSTPNPLTALESNSRRCSRWQFECKSSGECIAIYNACDGIPNCEDGSDESPELHCPSVIGANPVLPQWKPQSPVVNQQQQLQQSTNSGVEKASATGSLGSSHLTPNSPVYQSQQGLQQIYPMGNEPPLSQKNEHIFNHKNAGVMDPSYGNQLQQQKQHDTANTPFWKQQPYDYGGEQISSGNVFGSGTNYGGQQQQSSRVYENNGAGNPVNFQSGGSNFPYPNNGPYPNQPGILRPFQSSQGGQYVPTNAAGQGQTHPVFLPGGGQEINQQPNSGHAKDPSSSNSVQPTKIINQGGLPSPAVVSNGNQPAASGVQPVTVSSSTSAPKEEKESEVKAPILLNGNKSFGKVDPEAKLEDEILASLKSQPYSSQNLDVQMEEMSPHGAGPGAFILLILGVVMSIVMAIVIGCRLRRIGLGHGRRRRKNRLDSDYLVDGMYL